MSQPIRINNVEFYLGNDVCYVELHYPPRYISPPADHPKVSTVEIGLSDVRSADSIRIRYDFQRDGWSIQQAGKFEWDEKDTIMDEDWQEVAFVQAWARDTQGDRE